MARQNMSFELLAWSFPFGDERLERILDILLAEDMESIVDLRECPDLWASKIAADVSLAELAFLQQCIDRIRAGEQPPQKPTSSVQFTVANRSIAPLSVPSAFCYRLHQYRNLQRNVYLFPNPLSR